MRLLIRPVCPQSTSETPTYKGESWWGLKPPVPRKAVRVWSVDPTFPQQGKPGCEVGLVPRALKNRKQRWEEEQIAKGKEETGPKRVPGSREKLGRQFRA